MATASGVSARHLLRRELQELGQPKQRPDPFARRTVLTVTLRLAPRRETPVLVGPVLPVGRQRRGASRNVPRAPADRVGQLHLIEQANGQILNGIGGMARLARVVGVLAEPSDEARPAWQLSQLSGQVLLPALLGHFEPRQGQRDGGLGRIGQGGNLGGEAGNAQQAPGQILWGQRLPGGVQPVLSRGHGPAGHPLVDERRDPLDHLRVDRLDHGRAGQHLHPVAHRAIGWQDDIGRIRCGVGRFGRRADLRHHPRHRVPQLLQIRLFRVPAARIATAPQDAPPRRLWEIGLKATPASARGERPVHQQRLECIETEQQLGPPDLFCLEVAVAHRHGRDVRNRRPDPLQRRRHAVGGDAAAAVQLAILRVRQIPVPTEQALGATHGLIERQVLQPVDRVVMHEALHGPELRHRFACLMYQLPHGVGVASRGGVGARPCRCLAGRVERHPTAPGRIACRAAVG